MNERPRILANDAQRTIFYEDELACVHFCTSNSNLSPHHAVALKYKHLTAQMFLSLIIVFKQHLEQSSLVLKMGT